MLATDTTADPATQIDDRDADRQCDCDWSVTDDSVHDIGDTTQPF